MMKRESRDRSDTLYIAIQPRVINLEESPTVGVETVDEDMGAESFNSSNIEPIRLSDCPQQGLNPGVHPNR